jgi:hypothetical protein
VVALAGAVVFISATRGPRKSGKAESSGSGG